MSQTEYFSYTLNWAGQFEGVKRRLAQVTLLDEWECPDATRAQLREEDHSYWISSPTVGAIRFDLSAVTISAYPIEGLDARRFERALTQEWLPLVYHAWGFQVLHASAAVHRTSRRVVAFSGLAGAGKSTLGYGLGQRPGWQQIADESLAMIVGEGCVRLTPIPNFARLRPASVLHYDVRSPDQEMLTWPQLEMGLDHVFFLEEAPPQGEANRLPVQISPLDGAEAYPLFLQQAFALTLKLREHSRRLMQAYLQVARLVPAYRLVYPKSFSVIDEILDNVEGLVHSTGQTAS